MARKQKSNQYKDTLNLPKTDFDMRAGLLKKEPAIQARWQEADLYGRIRSERNGAPKFILHDGPPYANGNIHIGHTLNKVLKDMVVRLKTMTGFDAPYLPGWDCHGLPIEAKVMDEMGNDARRLDAMAVRKACQKYAAEFVELQSDQFQRLGVMGEFDDPYITMNPGYESAVLEVFARLIEQGLVFRQLKPVHWSIENRTALADAELEYHDREDSSVYVLFPVTDGDLSALPAGNDEPLHVMIWTTTPWTLPANRAVAVHPNFDYSVVRMTGADKPGTVILAAGRLEAVRNATGLEAEVLGTLKGEALLEAGLSYQHPIEQGRRCPLVAADYVTLEDGTGMVHTAPGHGLEDYFTAKRSGLEVYCPVGDDGCYDQSVPEFLQGLSVWDGNTRVMEHLRNNGLLAAKETITHSYPHDWRSKTPTIFRATEQWFIGVDTPLADGSGTLRELALNVARKAPDNGGAEFIPAWGRNRMTGMLESRPDWCISRQRAWGLPIPAFFNANGEALCTPASVRAVAAVFAEKGSDSWFELSPAELLRDYDPAGDDALQVPSRFVPEELTKGMDIFDVWFESGSSWSAVCERRGLVEEIPADMYLEGSDQHRGWFQLSLLPALGARGKAPFQTVLTHGFINDEQGRKMSKSLGNTVDVLEQLSKRGADILRLWVASQDYLDDDRCSDALIAQCEDTYRKIRNTLRFCMGSLHDVDLAASPEPEEHSVDRWMRFELHRLIDQVRRAMDRYEFHRASRLIYEFCTTQASSVYLSAVKDRLYCEAPDSPRRRATQGVIHEMLLALVKLLAPILPHTAEEAWDHIPARSQNEPDSVHLARLPEADAAVLEDAARGESYSVSQLAQAGAPAEASLQSRWACLMELRSRALGKLEALRNAGVKNPLDAEVVFTVPNDAPGLAELLETHLAEMEDLLGVGHARLTRGETDQEHAIGIAVRDTREEYPRCERSWKRRPDVGSDPAYPDLSARDAAVMKQLDSTG